MRATSTLEMKSEHGLREGSEGRERNRKVGESEREGGGGEGYFIFHASQLSIIMAKGSIK